MPVAANPAMPAGTDGRTATVSLGPLQHEYKIRLGSTHHMRSPGLRNEHQSCPVALKPGDHLGLVAERKHALALFLTIELGPRTNGLRDDVGIGDDDRITFEVWQSRCLRRAFPGSARCNWTIGNLAAHFDSIEPVSSFEPFLIARVRNGRPVPTDPTMY